MDGGDDVAHAAGPGPLQRGQEDGLADEHELAGLGGVDVEHFVVDVDELTPAVLVMPAADDALPVQWRRPVERRCHGRPPVDDERFPIGVVDGQPTDPDQPAVVTVDPADHQRLVAQAQTLEPAERVSDAQVAFKPKLTLATPLPGHDLFADGGCFGADHIEAVLSMGDERLLG